MRVVIPVAPYGLITDLKLLQAAAKSHCDSVFARTTVTNSNSGDLILMSNSGVKHTLHKAQPPLVNSTYVLDQILIHAIKTGRVVDKLNRPDTPWVHLYDVQLEFAVDDTVLDCYVVVKEDRQGVLRYYDHGAIKK